jgi:outer membrane protein TolC
VGRASLTDANLAEIIVAQAGDERSAADADLESSSMTLAALIGVDRAALPPISEEPIPRPDLTMLLSTASSRISTSGEPVSLALQQHYEDAHSRLERSNARPTLGVRATYGADGATHQNMDDTWTAGIALKWNLYDGGETFARSERAAQRSQQLRYQRNASLRDRQMKLDQARSESQSVTERISLAERVVELAKANYQDTRAQYRAGRLTMTQVGDSSFRLTEAYYKLLSLRYQEAVLGHELERLAE